MRLVHPSSPQEALDARYANVPQPHDFFDALQRHNERAKADGVAWRITGPGQAYFWFSN